MYSQMRGVVFISWWLVLISGANVCVCVFTTAYRSQSTRLRGWKKTVPCETTMCAVTPTLSSCVCGHPLRLGHCAEDRACHRSRAIMKRSNAIRSKITCVSTHPTHSWSPLVGRLLLSDPSFFLPFRLLGSPPVWLLLKDLK